MNLQKLLLHLQKLTEHPSWHLRIRVRPHEISTA